MSQFGPYRNVDIGIDAPLDQSGQVRPLDRGHRISFRWFVGALLTGVAGAAMMGGAVLGTVEASRTILGTPVSAPAFASQRVGPPGSVLTRTISKPVEETSLERQAQLIKPVDIALAKRTFTTKAMVKSGDRELLQTRRYTRVSAPLEAYAAAGRDIPRFNPMVLISEANANRNFSRVTLREDPNADVSISTVDLGGAKAKAAPFALDDDAALAQAVEALTASGGASVTHSPITMLEHVTGLDAEQAATDFIAFTPLPGSPFAKLEVRLVPENFAGMTKLNGNDLAIRHREDVTVIGADGSIAESIAALNVDGKVARAAEKALKGLLGKAAVAPGDRIKLRYAMALTSSGRSDDLVNVTYYSDDQIKAIIGRRDDGAFEAVAIPDVSASRTQERGDRLTVFASIYETGLRQGVPRALVDELVRVCSYDIDFQRPVSPSDAIDFVYAEPESGSEEQGELLYVSISLGGDEKKYFRFQSGKDDDVDFYDPQGRSGRKFLLRMPVAKGELRSGFGWRRHPILGYMKMHTGVDWANNSGAPILAAGNGVIRKASWDSGYGRRVEIEHANGYLTTYSHMSRFGDGIAEGVRVRQGQVIGFVGSSGLSTGPHLHYEVIVNDNFLDPMAIKLPRGRELQAAELEAFKVEKNRVADLLQKSQSGLVAEATATNQ
jgi:murein DD-endopeptidase MepM/ murein hydrolase activator NlpD